MFNVVSIVDGVYVLVFVLLCSTFVLSSFAIISLGRESWLLYFIVFLMSWLLPPGVVGWYAVGDCDIFWSYSKNLS